MMKEIKVLIMTALFGFLLVGFSVIAPTVSTASANAIRVYVDDVEVKFPDQKPFINQDNRTLVPIRFVSNALGANVEWVQNTKMVVINHEEKMILLTLGENFAKIGTKKINLDTTATLVNNRTMIPLRFVSECLGGHVYWNDRERKIFITTRLPLVNEFSGIPFKSEDLPFKRKSRPLAWSDKPSARIQYVKPSEFPINLSENYTIYNLTVDENYIYIKMYSKTRFPAPMYIVENGKLSGNRCYTSDSQEKTIFTYKYPVQSQLEQATGDMPLNLSKINGFAVYTIADEGFRMLVIENPLYHGGS